MVVVLSVFQITKKAEHTVIDDMRITIRPLLTIAEDQF